MSKHSAEHLDQKTASEVSQLRMQISYLERDVHALLDSPVTEIVRERTEYKLHPGFILLAVILIITNLLLIIK